MYLFSVYFGLGVVLGIRVSNSFFSFGGLRFRVRGVVGFVSVWIWKRGKSDIWRGLGSRGLWDRWGYRREFGVD